MPESMAQHRLQLAHGEEVLGRAGIAASPGREARQDGCRKGRELDSDIHPGRRGNLEPNDTRHHAVNAPASRDSDIPRVPLQPRVMNAEQGRACAARKLGEDP